MRKLRAGACTCTHSARHGGRWVRGARPGHTIAAGALTVDTGQHIVELAGDTARSGLLSPCGRTSIAWTCQVKAEPTPALAFPRLLGRHRLHGAEHHHDCTNLSPLAAAFASDANSDRLARRPNGGDVPARLLYSRYDTPSPRLEDRPNQWRQFFRARGAGDSSGTPRRLVRRRGSGRPPRRRSTTR